MNKDIQRRFAAIESRKATIVEKTLTEAKDRAAFLSSISAETHRLMTEVDSKINYIKHLYNNVDQSTYLAMSNAFNENIRKDVLTNIETLLRMEHKSISLDQIITKPDDKNNKQKTRIRINEENNETKKFD